MNHPSIAAAARIATLAAAVLAAACSAPPPAEPSTSATYTVAVSRGQRTAIASESLALELTSLDDSRCPVGAECVRAGQAMVGLLVSQPGEPADIVQLGLPGNAQRPDSARALGYRFKLVEVSPRPGETPKDVEPRATLVIVREGR